MRKLLGLLRGLAEKWYSRVTGWLTSGGLGSYSKRVAEGQTRDDRTVLFKGQDPVDVIGKWASLLYPSIAAYGRLEEVEREQEAKIGSFFPILPLEQRRDGIMAYFGESVGEGPSRRAMDAVLASLSPRGVLQPLSLERATESLGGGTNSGMPRFRRPWQDEDGRALEAEMARDYVYHHLSCILFARSGPSGLDRDPRPRTVWGYPKSASIREMQIFRPAQQQMLGAAPLSAWRTPEAVDQAVFALMQEADKQGDLLFSTDFSGYDSTLRRNWQESCWEILSAFYQPREIAEILESVAHYFLSCPLWAGGDWLFHGVHGVPSGSVFTNWIDSVAHWLAQETIADLLGSSRHPLSQIQGDDGLLVLPGVRDVSDIERAYAQLGFTANAEKQFVGQNDCLYLQKYYLLSHGPVGMYPTMRALQRVLFQERFYDPEIWGPDLVTLRIIMILENCKGHPLFAEFVRFVQSGDKYRLGAAWPGGIDALISSAAPRAKDLAGFVPSYNQERRLTGIRRFAVYQLIKESE